MALFKIGDKITQANTKEKGTIIKIVAERRGQVLYRVTYSDRDCDEREANLKPYTDISDPFERCIGNYYGNYIDFTTVNTSFKILNSNNSTLSSLKASKTIFKAYQYTPLLKFVNSDNHRLLVADEVGLGKTIEAGHIMLEMKARRELKNVLIICPMSLFEKWRTEMNEKFGLNFKIYDSIDYLIGDLQYQDGTVRGIINYEKIRKNGNNFNKLTDYLEQDNTGFSLVICDEAHKLRNSSTKTYKASITILRNTDAAIFLTATPIMIGEENLYNLLHLLDEQKYSNKKIFINSLHLNRPFIEALRSLENGRPLKEIAGKLETDSVQTDMYHNEDDECVDIVRNYYKDYPLYQRIIEELKSGKDTPQTRAQLRFDLSSMSPMNNIFSRTRKKEVITDWSQAERKPQTYLVKLYLDERINFDNVIKDYENGADSYNDIWEDLRLSPGRALGLVQKKRRIASSVYGYLNSVEDLDRGIDKFKEFPDAKFDELVKIIKIVHGNSKIIVFALFKNTIKYLAIRLKRKGYGCAIISGDIKDRDEEILRFKNDQNINILLSTEVGSEGLDMQFCNTIVNYDLPWNPMVVEQRIGRIDRFGQKSQIVNIYTLVVEDSIQEDIYTRLLKRIGIFKESIGDLEAILDGEILSEDGKKNITIQEMFSNIEKEFYCQKLTKEERNNKLERISRAIESEKINQKNLSENLVNTLTYDSYFKREINKINDTNSYVTEKELVNYVEYLLREKLSTCSLMRTEDDVYELTLPKSNPHVLSNFLTEYQPFDNENEILFKQFKNEIIDKTKILLTFNQEKAFSNKQIIYINLYNPIIQACCGYFRKTYDSIQNTFCFSINKCKLSSNVSCGVYFLALYQLTSTRKIYGVTKQSDILYPVLYDVQNGCLIDDDSIVNDFWGKSQTEGEMCPSMDFNGFPIDDVIKDMRLCFYDKVSDYQDDYLEDLKMRMETFKKIQIDQVSNYYKSLIDTKYAIILEKQKSINFDDAKEFANYQNYIQLEMGKINKLLKQEEEVKDKINQDSYLPLKNMLLSLNQIIVK
jgi:superfamily II DNA or RNA helicase